MQPKLSTHSPASCLILSAGITGMHHTRDRSLHFKNASYLHTHCSPSCQRRQSNTMYLMYSSGITKSFYLVKKEKKQSIHHGLEAEGRVPFCILLWVGKKSTTLLGCFVVICFLLSFNLVNNPGCGWPLSLRMCLFSAFLLRYPGPSKAQGSWVSSELGFLSVSLYLTKHVKSLDRQILRRD